MFVRFNLRLDDKKIKDDLYVNDATKTEYKKEHKRYRDKLISRVKDRFENNLSLNGSKISNEWFPMNHWDVFISHSHEDENLAVHLASWLKRNFGLKTFVDSFVWGSSDELLKVIDDEYCVSSRQGESVTYDYNKRNFSTSHVHMMLSGALAEVINNTECIIFLNTPSSLKVADLENQITNSPWIYNELKISSIVSKIYPRKEIVKAALLRNNSGIYKTIQESLQIDYDVSNELNSFIELSPNDLVKWKKADHSDIHPLDVLYFLIKDNVKI